MIGRRSMACAALVFTAGFITHPAEAKDRYPATAKHDRAALAERIAPREANVKQTRQNASAASMERAAAPSAVLDHRSGSRNGTPTAPLREPQVANPDPLSLKLGSITVRPAFGGIKGAEFSIGF